MSWHLVCAVRHFIDNITHLFQVKPYVVTLKIIFDCLRGGTCCSIVVESKEVIEGQLTILVCVVLIDDAFNAVVILIASRFGGTLDESSHTLVVH